MVPARRRYENITWEGLRSSRNKGLKGSDEGTAQKDTAMISTHISTVGQREYILITSQGNAWRGLCPAIAIKA